MSTPTLKEDPSTTTIVRSDGDYLLGVFKKASTPYWFNGTIDEVKISQHTLCSPRIAEQPTKSLTTPLLWHILYANYSGLPLC